MTLVCCYDSARRTKKCKRPTQWAIEGPLGECPRTIRAKKRSTLNHNADLVAAKCLARTPIYTSVKSSEYRKRMKLMPTLPKKLSELDIEGDWRTTNDGKDFLLGCDGTDNKIVLFGTEGFLRRLCSGNTVFMDGIFKSAPKLFTQMYTLHCFVIGVIIPLAYALLPNKSTLTYSRMFKIIKEAALRNGLEFKPACFQIDFEIGMIVSIRQCFGSDTPIKGCLFHFGPNIFILIKELKIQQTNF
ncbi:uncharacterized protein LOC132926148 [Rhopalosiphum padi]|uniref:uncharacterized protein LOC132926148 n=1 Tax=Rhopalosiphum padi TaxID=40932 RepID=UPI00298DC0E1|nr:uncharacterized protein LOC132926148 [Rhopalosiphum padi]